MTEAALVADDHVVVAQVESAESARIERHIALVVIGDAGQPLHEGSVDVPAPVSVRHEFGRVEAGMDRRFRKEGDQFFEDVFCAADLVEPVVHQGDAPPG